MLKPTISTDFFICYNATMKLFCVIPFYNEQEYLKICLSHLAAQTDKDFTLILVNNVSTDNSVEVIKDILANSDLQKWKIITENQKGTGAASDTGFNYAISKGATHILRTDADCAVSSDWIAEAKKSVMGGDQLVLGKITYQNVDNLAKWYDPLLYNTAIIISQLYGTLHWGGREYKSRFKMGVGYNMLISAYLYKKSGGFLRISIETDDEDIELFNRVRRLTPNVSVNPKMKSNSSLRRIRKHGYIKTMLYYWGRKFKPANVDIR